MDSAIVYIIWGIFVLDFAIRFTLAPRKLSFLRTNWLTVLSLLVPALRVFRIFRVIRVLSATRGLRLVKVIGSLNRGMNALARSMGRRGFGYVLLLTAVITLVGAAGVFAFERGMPGGEGTGDFGDAIWYTAMIMTTLGSDYWPKTAEGRVLTFLLALYAFAIFGYVTATLATYFIGREAESQEAELPGAQAIESLRVEMEALRAEIRAMAQSQGDS